jgi:hypothetical protein
MIKLVVNRSQIYTFTPAIVGRFTTGKPNVYIPPNLSVYSTALLCAVLYSYFPKILNKLSLQSQSVQTKDRQ